MKERVRLTKKVKFESAHYLPKYEGLCGRLHGHSYKLELTISGLFDFDLINAEEPNYEQGMLLDFVNLKNAINTVVIKYDHSCLNDYFPVPTAECMVVQIYRDFVELAEKYIVPEGFKVESVKLWETEDSYAEYRGKEE